MAQTSLLQNPILNTVTQEKQKSPPSIENQRLIISFTHNKVADEYEYVDFPTNQSSQPLLGTDFSFTARAAAYLGCRYYSVHVDGDGFSRVPWCEKPDAAGRVYYNLAFMNSNNTPIEPANQIGSAYLNGLTTSAHNLNRRIGFYSKISLDFAYEIQHSTSHTPFNP